MGSLPLFSTQATPVGEAGTSSSAPSLGKTSRMDPSLENLETEGLNLQVGLSASSLRTRIVELEDKIVDLQRDLRVQAHTVERALANENFMLTEVKKAAEQLACEHTSFC